MRWELCDLGFVQLHENGVVQLYGMGDLEMGDGIEMGGWKLHNCVRWEVYSCGRWEVYNFMRWE